MADVHDLPPELLAAIEELVHTDVLVVGSSRFAAPKRIFLGSTASRILAGTDAPVIVIPRGEE